MLENIIRMSYRLKKTMRWMLYFGLFWFFFCHAFERILIYKKVAVGILFLMIS